MALVTPFLAECTLVLAPATIRFKRWTFLDWRFHAELDQKLLQFPGCKRLNSMLTVTFSLKLLL
jgi:hypothetical protein